MVSLSYGGLGDQSPQQAKPVQYAANKAEIEQVPFCAVTRPRLQLLCRKVRCPS